METKKIKNIALIGHSGEGKTSLLEAILFQTKAIDRLGKVDEGNSTSDFDAEEISRKMSISMSFSYINYKDYKINIIDVPGFFDFEGEMVGALAIVDAAIIVASASGGISIGTERCIKYCTKNKIPCLIYINGVNRENSDFYKTLECYKQKYGNKICPIELPIMEGLKITGFIDTLENQAYNREYQPIAVPAHLQPTVDEFRNYAIEFSAETEDELIEKFFGGIELTKNEVIRGLKTRVINSEVIPLLAGKAVTNYFISNLLEHIINLLPNPEEGKPYRAIKDDNIIEVRVDCEAKFSGRIFKTIVDAFVGKLLVMKVQSGSIKLGDSILLQKDGSIEKVTSLFLLKGKKQDAVSSLEAGDIGAIAKTSNVNNGETISDGSLKFRFEDIAYPTPMISMAVYSAEKGMEDKIFSGIAKLKEEDPTFSLDKNIETGEMIISGLGETQLDILIKKVRNKYKVNAVLALPKIPYRETIRKTVEQQGKYKKQSGGHGQYGDAYIRFEPLRGEDFVFSEEIVGGVIPKQYFPAVEKGLRESIVKGTLAGYPVVGLKATLYFGSYHDVDSSEMAFINAAKLAYKEGMANANPVLLEPIYDIKVTVPETYLGDVMGDLNKRRGKISGMETADDKSVIKGEVPLAEVQRYATDLRSMTQGRGKFKITFNRYDDVPQALVGKIIEKSRLSDAVVST